MARPPSGQAQWGRELGNRRGFLVANYVLQKVTITHWTLCGAHTVNLHKKRRIRDTCASTEATVFIFSGQPFWISGKGLLSAPPHTQQEPRPPQPHSTPPHPHGVSGLLGGGGSQLEKRERQGRHQELSLSLTCFPASVFPLLWEAHGGGWAAGGEGCEGLPRDCVVAKMLLHPQGFLRGR